MDAQPNSRIHGGQRIGAQLGRSAGKEREKEDEEGAHQPNLRLPRDPSSTL